MTQVLVIDDEPQLRNALRFGLQQAGFAVSIFGNGVDGFAEALATHPDIVLLDLLLPDTHGLAICQQLRAALDVPIIILSVQRDEEAKIAALNSGADDYLTKPFSFPELVARMGAVLRRSVGSGRSDASFFQGGDLFIDFTGRKVTLAGKEVHLTPKEYALLQHLVLNAGRVLTYRALLTAAWGPESQGARTLRVHIANLRNKLEHDPTRPCYIHTEMKVGYRFRVLEKSGRRGI